MEEYILNWGEKNHRVVTKEEAEATVGSFKYIPYYNELYIRTKNGTWYFIGEV